MDSSPPCLTFDAAYPIDSIAPAEYNPRQIDAEGKARLADSVRELGILKPIIVNGENGTIIAGHQRSNALKALGHDTVPAYVLKGVKAGDEVRFNQIHNGCDHEATADVRVAVSDFVGWQWVNGRDVEVLVRPGHAARLSEALRLLRRYGPWGSCVVTTAGRVVTSPLYAMACRTLRMPLLVHVVTEETAERVAHYFGFEYGRYSYRHLPKETWVQTLAQMFRCRNGSTKSRTYEELGLPAIREQPGCRVLDFGAGQMDYVKRLRAAGVDIIGVEFYYRRQGSTTLAVGTAQRHITALCDSLKTHGLFDIVICDSVMNSIDSREAGHNVMATIAALCRTGGQVIFSGRSREACERNHSDTKRIKDNRRLYLEFYDEDGITAMFNRGGWLYQCVHTKEQAAKLATEYVGPKYVMRGGGLQSSWRINARKTIELPADVTEAALRAEFDLPLPGGKSFGRSDDIVNAWKEARNA